MSSHVMVFGSRSATVEEVERALINEERLRAALEDIAQQPVGDEQSAQAVAREALKFYFLTIKQEV